MKSNWKTLKALLLLTIAISLITSGCKDKSTDQLLMQGKIKSAIKQCKGKEGKEKIDCAKKIALFYFENDQFKKAALFYSQAGDHERAMSCYLLADSIADAETYCNNQTGEVQKKCALQLGRVYYLRANYEQSIHYYQLAGNAQKVAFVTSKIPIFQLVNRLDKAIKETKEKKIAAKKQGQEQPNQKDLEKEKQKQIYRISRVKTTIRDYIYLPESLRKWRFKQDTEVDKEAAAICEKAIKIIEEQVAPTLLTKTEDLLATSLWTGQEAEAAGLEEIKLNRLTKLLKAINKIAVHRTLFTTHSVVYLPPQTSPKGKSKTKSDTKSDTGSKEKPAKSLNYEEAYRKALTHAKGVFDTIKIYEKLTGKDLLKDFTNDMDVDMDIVQYISGMLDNIRARIMELERNRRQIKKKTKDIGLHEKVNKYLKDFNGVCNRVLHIIGKGNYKEANAFLLSGYKIAKDELVKIDKSITPPDPKPAQ